MVIKTGCSSSLVGLHEACRALQSGDCDAALVAGTNLIMGPTTTAAMTQEGILSPNGSCATFDAAADGFARGEAINAIYIKTLDKALEDKNPIRAVIRNTASNSDGRGSSLMAPNGSSHEKMMRKVYRDCGLDPKETRFVECHGTGTATGDPIETTAVGNVFSGDNGIFIGSVKPNVGHAEGASGLTSVIKAVLSLQNGMIPPNIKFKNPNPKIPFSQKKPNSCPLNRHCGQKAAQRSEYPSIPSVSAVRMRTSFSSRSERAVGKNERRFEESQASDNSVLLFSANTQESLQRLSNDIQTYCQKYPERLADIAYTLALRREHLPRRAFAIAGKERVKSISLSGKAAEMPSRIILTFSGQGAQWPKMGLELMKSDRKFLEDIKALDQVLHSLIHPPTWSIEEELMKDSTSTQLDKAEIAQPLCTAIQIALVNAIRRMGVRPAAVIGHSSGEIAAAYSSYALSLEAAIIVAYYRGYITRDQGTGGGMAAVGLGRSKVSPLLGDGVILACENSPQSSTISGNTELLDQKIAEIKKAMPETFVRRLKVDQAYHSRKSTEYSICTSFTRLPTFNHITNRSYAQPRKDLYFPLSKGVPGKTHISTKAAGAFLLHCEHKNPSEGRRFRSTPLGIEPGLTSAFLPSGDAAFAFAGFKFVSRDWPTFDVGRSSSSNLFGTWLEVPVRPDHAPGKRLRRKPPRRVRTALPAGGDIGFRQYCTPWQCAN